MKHILVIILLSYSIVCIAQTANPAPYCNAMGISNWGGGAISSVSIRALNNKSGLTNNLYGYTYFNNVPADTLNRDSTYTLTVVFDTIYHTGSFGGRTDNTKYLVVIPFDTLSLGGYTEFEGIRSISFTGNVNATYEPDTIRLSVTVPHDAFYGLTRLRIVRYGADVKPSKICACNGRCQPINQSMNFSGETEDYDLYIDKPKEQEPPIPPNSIPSPHTSPISIFPNPTTGLFKISGLNGLKIVFDMMGRVVYRGEGEMIDISGQPTGVYVVRVGDSVGKIMKE